jgi:aminoglycoside/choline kinase family phosphotransferase
VLEDARIQVARTDALRYVEYFSQKKEMDIEPVLLNYHILGAQRNSRILGIFARKAIRDHDDSYLQYIPRVLKYLEYDLSYVALSPLKDWLDKLGSRI